MKPTVAEVIGEARELLASLATLSEVPATHLEGEHVSTSKPGTATPRRAGVTYMDEALANYEAANREVRKLLKRAGRAERPADTAEGKRYWLLASHEGQSSRHVADMTDYSPAQVRRFRREAGRHEETGMPLGRVA